MLLQLVCPAALAFYFNPALALFHFFCLSFFYLFQNSIIIVSSGLMAVLVTAYATVVVRLQANSCSKQQNRMYVCVCVHKCRPLYFHTAGEL